MKVGVIGLGLMGMGFSKSLLRQGYEVYGFDVNPLRNEDLAACGGIPCADVVDLAEKSDAIIMLVFNADNVRSVLYEGGLIKGLKSGKTLIVSCSVGADVLYEISADVARTGAGLVDAPLMGDCFDAESAEIKIMVAASKESFAPVEGLLKDMGSDLFFVSEIPGKGQEAKTCLQALFSMTFEMGFEITNLALKTGVNMDEIRRMFAAGPSSCPLFHITEDKVLSETYTGTKNPLAILAKDISIAVELGEKYGLKLNACKGIKETFCEALEKYPKEDIWAASKVVANK